VVEDHHHCPEITKQLTATRGSLAGAIQIGSDNHVTEITLNVPDISCGHCKSSIEGAVGDLEGVDKVDVAIDARTVDVSFDSPADMGAVVAAIEEQGYEVATS